MYRKISIIVDYREPSEIVSILKDQHPFDFDIKISSLFAGDFLIDDVLLIERKTIKDFCVSIIDGRLFSQASRLRTSGHQPLLILEGKYDELKNLKIHYRAIQGAMISLIIKFGIPILYSSEIRETCDFIIYASTQIQKQSLSVLGRYGYRPKTKKYRQLFILQGLPNIGKKRASLLLKKFGTVENIMKASYEELASLNGIGPKIAKEIRYIISEIHGTYQ